MRARTCSQGHAHTQLHARIHAPVVAPSRSRATLLPARARVVLSKLRAQDPSTMVPHPAHRNGFHRPLSSAIVLRAPAPPPCRLARSTPTSSPSRAPPPKPTSRDLAPIHASPTAHPPRCPAYGSTTRSSRTTLSRRSSAASSSSPSCSRSPRCAPRARDPPAYARL
eukprot:6177483-Pleurochrysis_carterae.AAC.2